MNGEVYKMYDYRLNKQLSLTDILSFEWIKYTDKDEILKAWDEYGDELSCLGRLVTPKKPLMKFREDGAKCPRCGRYLFFGASEPNFCSNCGQRLVWDGIDQWKEI